MTRLIDIDASMKLMKNLSCSLRAMRRGFKLLQYESILVLDGTDTKISIYRTWKHAFLSMKQMNRVIKSYTDDKKRFSRIIKIRNFKPVISIPERWVEISYAP